MKSSKLTSEMSASRLLNKKLTISDVNNTPKYVESKIYISTRQINTHNQNHPINHQNRHHNHENQLNQKSIKKTIDTKLDLIKQEISR